MERIVPNTPDDVKDGAIPQANSPNLKHRNREKGGKRNVAYTIRSKDRLGVRELQQRKEFQPNRHRTSVCIAEYEQSQK